MNTSLYTSRPLPGASIIPQLPKIARLSQCANGLIMVKSYLSHIREEGMPPVAIKVWEEGNWSMPGGHAKYRGNSSVLRNFEVKLKARRGVKVDDGPDARFEVFRSKTSADLEILMDEFSGYLVKNWKDFLETPDSNIRRELEEELRPHVKKNPATLLRIVPSHFVRVWATHLHTNGQWQLALYLVHLYEAHVFNGCSLRNFSGIRLGQPTSSVPAMDYSFGNRYVRVLRVDRTASPVWR